MSSPFEFPEVRVVEASAGSGKTYALTKRYVQLLLYTAARFPLGIKTILAITFTNKAAAEMKSRIIDLLKRIALGKLSAAQVEDILTPLGLDVPQARAAAQGIMQDLIRHYHFFQVQTIDSFMNALLAGCAFKINLSARFKIKRNVPDYLQQSLDRLIDQAHENKKVKSLFETFVRQYLLLENRSGWFPKKDLLSVLMVLFNQYNTYQRPFLKFESAAETLEYKKQFVQAAARIQTLLPPAADKRFVQSLGDFIEKHPYGFDIDEVSRYFARELPPVNGGNSVPGELADLWDNARRLLRAICLQEAYGLFNPYVDLFESVMGHLGRLQTKEDILFLQQLNKKTADLFQDAGMSVEELYFRLATRFRHYLMDEFQDTSLAQWLNLRPMIEEALASGGTLFYVGDKKQAIYSFRGGRSLLFEEVQEGFTHFNVRPETLSTNYRSQQQILEFNNSVFSLENLKAFTTALEQQSRLKEKDIAFGPEDWERFESIFGKARQISRPESGLGAVRLEVIGGRRKQEREETTRRRLLEIVRDAHTRFAYADMAVLTRNNEEVERVTQWLVQEGIYAQSERTTDVKSHFLVRDIAAFLRFLHSPVDNVAFVELLLGELFPKTSGLAPQHIRDFLFSARQNSIRTEVYFYKAFRDAYPELWQSYFEDFFNQVGTYPLYELVVSFVGRWKCLELFPDAQGFVMHFLELIKRREEDSCDLEIFLDYFEGLQDEERFVPMPIGNAVRVLTVHKAKGLEFAVVIIPFLEMAIKTGSGDKNGGQSFVLDPHKDGVYLLRLKESYTRFCEELKERYMQEYKEAFFAELNNVYVALTRAAWEIHALIPERVGNSVNPVPLLIAPELFFMGQFHPGPLRHLGTAPASFLPACEHRQWMDHLQEEFLQEATNREAKLQGEVIHFCFSQWLNLSNIDINEAVRAAVQAARVRFPQVTDWPVYEHKLKQLLGQPQWKKFFFLPEHVQVLCEQEIVNRFGDTRRLDRVIVWPDKVWVVDFKTSKGQAGAHQQQILEYERLLALIYPGRSIEGFLLYVDHE